MSVATSFELGQEMIKQYFVDSWPSTASSALPYVFENDVFQGDPSTDYMEFIVRENDSIQVTCGPNARYRVLGSVVGLFHGGLDDGSVKLRTYADSLSLLFRNLLFNNISFHAPKFTALGRDDSHYSGKLIIPFKFDFVASR